MNTIKRIVSVILVLICCTSIIGCSTHNYNTDNEKPRGSKYTEAEIYSLNKTDGDGCEIIYNVARNIIFVDYRISDKHEIQLDNWAYKANGTIDINGEEEIVHGDFINVYGVSNKEKVTIQMCEDTEIILWKLYDSKETEPEILRNITFTDLLAEFTFVQQ